MDDIFSSPLSLHPFPPPLAPGEKLFRENKKITMLYTSYLKKKFLISLDD